MIHDALNQARLDRDRRRTEEREKEAAGQARPKVRPKLWASEIGGCPRKVMLRVLGYEGEPWTAQGLHAMRIGVLMERENVGLLAEAYGVDRLETQARIENPIWTAKLDVLIDRSAARPCIIEHKALVGPIVAPETWWRARDLLPYASHVAQLVLYGQLFVEQEQKQPTLILYYWGGLHYAEFVITPEEGSAVHVRGHVDGKVVEQQRVVDVTERRQALEAYYTALELPPRLSDMELGCTWHGRPNCPMFRHCYPIPVEEQSDDTARSRQRDEPPYPGARNTDYVAAVGD